MEIGWLNLYGTMVSTPKDEGCPENFICRFQNILRGLGVLHSVLKDYLRICIMHCIVYCDVACDAPWRYIVGTQRNGSRIFYTVISGKNSLDENLRQPQNLDI